MLARNPTDVRDHILRTKAYEVRPVCVVRYVRRLDLSAKHEAVYWEVFRRAERQGWIARVSLATLAHETFADESTVTRALARLIGLGLIRRQNPGRVAGDPMRQAVSLYEIVFPPDMLAALLAAPDRHVARHLEAREEQPTPPLAPPVAAPAVAASLAPAAAPAAAEPSVDPMPELRQRYGSLPAIQTALKAKLSAAEAERLASHRQSARTGVLVSFEPDPDSRLDAVELAFLRCQPSARKVLPSTAARAAAPRRDSPLLMAELRARLTAAVGPARADALFDEAVWSLTTGTFAKEPCRAKAMHAIVKLMAEQRWTRPKRMPPNFKAARPEACRPA